MQEIFNDVARLGIESLDIRWNNILSVKDDSSGIICPNHGHVHRWRLIDFDLCRKSDGNLFFIDGSSRQWLSIIFMNVYEPSGSENLLKPPDIDWESYWESIY